MCKVGLAQNTPAQPSTPQFDLHDFHGRVVYVDFWASWCVPCRQSFPWLRALQSTYRSEGLVIMAINVDLDRADAEHFLRSYPANFPIVFDPQRSLAEHFKVKAMPTSELFDRHGTLRFTHIGFLPRDRGEYEQQVRSLLAEK